jgi:hypothetical protein
MESCSCSRITAVKKNGCKDRGFQNIIFQVKTFVKAWREFPLLLRLALDFAIVIVLCVLGFCYIYRFPVAAPLLAAVAATTFFVQYVEARHDWGSYQTSTKKASRILILLFVLVTAVYAGMNASTAWLGRPRIIDRILEWRMSHALVRYRGTKFQVVASGLRDYNEACNLKIQIESILNRAQWKGNLGECNRFPDQFGSTLIITYDHEGENAGLSLMRLLVSEWKNSSIIAQFATQPILPVLGPNPLQGSPGIPAPGARTIDVLVQVYDNVR